ncbi:MAG: sigma-54 dependent transcriptional regulator [Acidobacteriota bacterium]|nr:sigma-54 dependent transcriptional regulator [Acidobacteriota bacterium]
MATNKILVVDDDSSIRWMLIEALKEWGYEPTEASTCQAALFVHETESPAAVLLDIDLPDGSGLEALREIIRHQPEAIVIMVSAKGFFDTAVEALRGGAFDFISKPINLSELQVTLRNGLETRKLRKKINSLRRQQTHQFNFDQFIGQSPAMKEMILLASKVAKSEASAVLLQGESGTGKELVARAIHYGSSRADGPFVPINCAAIPDTLIESELFGHEKGSFTDAKTLKEGLFEQAEGGTLFLDEIGELEQGLQAKLLRVLEDGNFRRVGGLKDVPYDARIIAASNRDLKAGRFRSDLFYRLSVIQIELPPLRERGGDTLALAGYFIEHFNQHLRKHITGLSPEVAEIFCRYPWPGNVRELRNVIERVMILEDSDLITTAWLPHSLADYKQKPECSVSGCQSTQPSTAVIEATNIKHLFPLPMTGVSLDAVEKSLLLQAIELTEGNQTKAAELLHISRDQFRYRLKKIEHHSVANHHE